MNDNSSSDSECSARNVTTRPTKKPRPSPAAERSDNVEPSDTRRYRVKVPKFTPDEVEVWFALLESQFEAYGIKDDAIKFTHVLSNLDIVHAKTVKDLVINPPERHRYTKIKTELIRRLSASHEKKVKQLLTHEELGDRKPSEFLRHLQDLAGPAVPADFVKSIWSQRLPNNIQTVVASQPTLSLEQLADLADRVHDIVTPCSVAEASTSRNISVSNEIAELKNMVERLALRIDEQASNRGHPYNRSRQRQRTAPQRSKPRQRSRSTSEHKKIPMCWYHHTFGNRANKCIKPCDFSGNDAGSR